MTDGRGVIDLHRRALERARGVVSAVGDEQWQDPTPCSEWSVRDLVRHMTAECLWEPEILAGRSVEEIGDRFDGDVLGDAPQRAFDAAAQRSLGALGGLDDLQRTVHLSFGDVPVEVYLWQRFTDALIHSWDLAMATSQDIELDPVLCEAALEVNRPMVTDDVRAAGIIGPEVAIADDAPICDRLLGFLGRDPGWRPPAA